MSNYAVNRIGQAALVLWAAFTVAFVLLQALPGDAILIKFLSNDAAFTPEQLEDIRIAYGRDVPVILQYVYAIGNFLVGDFGYSVYSGVPVAQELAVNLPATLRLASLGFLTAAVLAVVLALLASLTPFTWLRNLILSVPALLISIPVFWLGIMLIQIFSFQLRWVSVINPGEWERLILPILTLSVPIAAPLAQILIRSIDDVQTQPFVAVARAKGAGRIWVLVRHVARNAILPVLTIAGVLFGELLAGTVVTETVFGLNGIGRLTQVAVGNQDTAVLQAIVVISAVGFVLINLVVDLLYPVLDPRLRSKLGAFP